MIDHELLACEQRAQFALDRMRAGVSEEYIDHHYREAKREITQAIRLAFERQDKALEHRFITFWSTSTPSAASVRALTDGTDLLSKKSILPPPET